MELKSGVITKVFGIESAIDVDDTGEVTFVASTMSLDKVNDRVYPKGCKAKGKLKLLYGHNSKDINALLGTIDASWSEDDKLIAHAKFNKSPSGQLARQLMKDGELDEFSISFMPTKYKGNDEGGYDFEECELTEISLVPTPAHRETSVLSVKSVEEAEIKLDKPIMSDKDLMSNELKVILDIMKDNPEEIKQMIRARLYGDGNI